MSSIVLRTKLHIPIIRTDIDSRERLITCLNAGIGRKLSFITASAGFGKTTLVVDWVGQVGRPVAWISLDESDNEPTRFFTYCIAALKTLDPGVGGEAMSLLRSSQPIETVLTLLINEMVTFSGKIILVFDDYHLISHPDIHTGMAFLLEYLPPQMHLVIISRSEPPLPLARLRAQGQLSEFGTADLRFTSGETAVFLKERIKVDLTEADLSTLEARIEGWVAGLQLVALSIQAFETPAEARQFIQSLSGRDRHIVDYLLAEVLECQTPARQSFLLQTSILERMCGPLCDAVLADGETEIQDRKDGLASILSLAPVSQKILEDLERDNLFILSLDNERSWYRYHPLFAELLRHRLEQRATSAELKMLHRRASNWFEAQGLMDEAIDHALAACDFDRVAKLLIPMTENLLWQQGVISRLLGWLNALPSETVEQYPKLVSARVLSSMLTFDIAGVRAGLKTLSRIPDLPVEIQTEVAAVQATLLYYDQGDYDQAKAHLRQAIALSPEDNLHLQIVLKLQMGQMLYEEWSLDEATQMLIEVVRCCRIARDRFNGILAQTYLGQIARQQGKPQRAVDILQEAFEWAAGSDGSIFPLAGIIHLCLGAIFFEWNDLEEAAKQIEQGLAFGHQTRIGYILWWGYQAQADLAHSRRDLARIKASLKEIKRLGDWLTNPRLTSEVKAYTDFYKARVALWRGDLDTVARWVERRGLQPSDRPETLRCWYEYKMLVSYLLARSHASRDLACLSGVEDLLRHLLRIAASRGVFSAAITLWNSLALVYHLQGNHDKALDALEQALILAESGGHVRLFLGEGQLMQTLLKQALKGDIASGYVRKLLNAFDAEIQQRPLLHHPQPDSQSEKRQPEVIPRHSEFEGPLDPLTERELEVLRYIAAGHTNREIADQMIISVNTVRAHLRNLYSKLHAQGRTHAVALARQLELL